MSYRSIIKTVLAKEQAEGVGAKVRRSIGSWELRNLDPFLMLDEFSVTPPAGFMSHPHRGQSTVTYMLKGIVEHEDFKGHRGKIGAGDLQWMSAGKGIVHAEMPGTENENTGLQLWINLPAKSKMKDPSYQEMFDHEVPKAQSTDGNIHVKVIAGECMGVKAKVVTESPIYYLDIKMKPNQTFEQQIPAHYTAFVYILSGSAFFGTNKAEGTPHHTLVMGKEGDKIQMETKDNHVHCVLIAGEPINEPIVQHGPFVMNTKEEIMQAIMDYQTCRNGFESAKNWVCALDARGMRH